MNLFKRGGLIKFIYKAFSAILIILVIAVSCKKEGEKNEPGKFGDLKGSIRNEHWQPIANAVITIGSNSKKSEADGTYYFQKLPVGACQVSVSKESFLDKIQNIEIIENKINIVDIKLESGEPSLELSYSILDVLSPSGFVNFDVTSNVAWQIENSCSWLICSMQSGEGNAKIKLSWTGNNGSERRTDSIFVRSMNIVKRIIVSQNFPIRLLVATGTMGNAENETKDSVLLIFNKPVNVSQIASQWNYCISAMEYTQVENNYGVRFSFSCADLGGRYPFEIIVRDDAGDTFDQIINVPFCEKMIDCEGTITDFFMTDDTKNCWISTKNPNRILYISGDSLKIIRSFNLNFTPRKFTLNPFNQFLYVLSGNPDTYSYENIIYVISPNNGTEVKKVIINPEANGHPNYPTIYPYSIGFSNTGYGVVLLHQDGSDGLDWRIIDSALDDTLYFHEAHGINTGQYQYFEKVYANFDRSKILLTEPYGSCDLDVLDGTSHEIVNIIPGSITRGVFITPNRINSRVYFGQLYDQFIMDLDGNMSQISYIDNRDNGNADFCYLQGKDDIIYFIDDYFLQVLDYGNSVTLMSCDIACAMRSLTVTLDGKNAYAYSGRYPGSSVFKFNTDDFWKQPDINQRYASQAFGH